MASSATGGWRVVSSGAVTSSGVGLVVDGDVPLLGWNGCMKALPS